MKVTEGVTYDVIQEQDEESPPSREDVLAAGFRHQCMMLTVVTVIT